MDGLNNSMAIDLGIEHSFIDKLGPGTITLLPE